MDQPLPPFSAPAQALKLGFYEHYKGNQYRVLAIARHSETLEELVVYQAQYGERGTWVRPLTMFIEDVDYAGKRLPRFRFLHE